MKLLKNYYNSIFSSQKKDVDFYDSLQDLIISKKQYYTHIHNSIINLSTCLNEFQIRISNLNYNLDNIEFPKEETNIHNLIKSIHKRILEKFKENIKTLDDINTHFTKYLDDLKTEIQIYKEYKDIYIKLDDEKIKLKKNEETYHDTGKKNESKIIQFVDRNIQNINQIEQSEELMDELAQLTFPTSLSYQVYEKSLNDVNNLVATYNQKHCKYFNYLPEILAKDEVFYYNLINAYVTLLKKENKKINEEIKKFEDANNIEKKENKSEMKKLIEKYEKNKIEEKMKKFIQYPTNILFTDCKNKKQFEVYFKSVDIIKKYVNKKIFPDYKYDDELNNFKMSELIRKLFSNKSEEINTNLKDTFNDLIENPSLYNTLFIILSKLRTNGTFSQSKALISLLGEGFEKVLINSKKNKLYENAKNIIILSQTYYYEDEKKEKIYIFEFIKNNKWLKTAKFWRNFINYMLDNDLKRFDKINEKDNFKLGEVVFSNLLTFASNMKSFEIDKRIIIKILDELFDKYNYVSEQNKQIIYQMIIQTDEDDVNIYEELTRLRKEYNESLENNKDENKNNKDKINNNEIKEVKKDDKKVDNVDENKKVDNIDEDKKHENIDDDKKHENIDEAKKDENINEVKKDENVDEKNK